MHIYFSSLQSIEQQSMQLASEDCIHCKQSHQLVSHGFIYKKQRCAEPVAIGKRVICSNRNRHTGCGRTMRLYLDSAVRYLHYAGQHVVAFVFSLMTGMTVQHAYFQVTGTADPRNAYRWLNRLRAQMSAFRSVFHQPHLQETAQISPPKCHPRWALLTTTFNGLSQKFGLPLCAAYQRQLQRSFC